MKRLLIFIILLSLLAGCGTAKSTETATATLPPAATLTATVAATATLTPVPTLTPTSTPLPTRTPYPTPTATPKGFYTSPMGFSLQVPSGWSIDDSNKDLLVVEATDGRLRMVAGGLYAQDTLDEFITGLCKSWLQNYASYTTDKDEQITLLDQSSAQRVTFTCSGSAGEKMSAQLIFTYRGSKLFLFLALTSTGSFNNNQLAALDSIHASINLTPSVVYGLPRAETLLLLGYDPEPEDLDPAISEGSPGGYLGLLYSGLVRINTDYQIVGDLAEDWVISPDGSVYTFTLRSGLTFQDGSPLSAADVKYSWERAADPANDSPTASTYLGDILGFKERLKGEADEVKGIVVIDERTLQVTLESPVQYFLSKLAYVTSYVVQQKAVEADPKEWMMHPVASGPYSLKELSADEYITFERNEQYYDPPKLRFIAFKTDTPGTNISYYQTGDADVTYPSMTDIKEIQAADNPLHDQLLTDIGMSTNFIMLNNSMPPMDDPNVRLALTLAIDKDKMVEQFLNNLYPRADAILPPGMPGFSEFEPQKFDPTAAREALKASAYANNMPELTMNVHGYAGDTDPYADALIQMWKENLGIKVKVEFLDPQEFTAAAHQDHGHIVLYGWSADYPDPANYLDVLFHSASDMNVSGYTNPQVDALLEKARTEPDPAARLGLYHQAETLLLDDHAAIPIYNSMAYTLVNPRVQGYKITHFGVNIYRSLWLSEP